MESELDLKTEHVFTWTLQNFSACSLKNGFCLESPVFMAESLDETTWNVNLYPRGNAGTTKEYISCFLKRSINCAGPDEVECDYTVEAIDDNNEFLEGHRSISKFKKGVAFGKRNFIRRDSIMKINTHSCDITLNITLRKRRPKLFSSNMCLTKFVTDQFSFKRNVKNSISVYADVKPFCFNESTKFEVIISIPADDVEISIRRIEGFQESQTLMCSVILMDLEGEEAESKEAIFESDEPHENDTWNFPTFLKQSKITAEKDKYLKEGYFTLKFSFSLSSGKTSESINDIDSSSPVYSLTNTKDLSASLRTGLKHLFTNSVHTDVELHADEKVFRAHKVILCARSPVFFAMFNQNMAEKQSGVINIPDVEAATLNSLLEFMYTGEAEILNYESALKLLLASDKYQVWSLKAKCSSSLELLLSDENVCDVLFYADMVQQKSLKVCAVNYIKKKSKKILKSKEWKEMANKNFKLATETFYKVSTL